MPTDDRARHPQPLLHLPGFALAHLGRLTRSAIRRVFTDGGMSVSAHLVLVCLDEYDGLSQRELADYLAMDRSDLGKILDALETSGAVRRGPDPNDRRRHRLSLTAEGSETVRQGTELMKLATDEILAGLTPGDRADLHRLILLALEPPNSAE
ncbi:MarR family transcriptional regulator [Nocardia sp. NEAU-G5]|uniref:MarR family transcriptional regulator n=1 Tax=Nocardia albiluteola TaxID=2842303 RepID=A0ABS6ATZ2_9NOCA|nr:MarR family transcriptional regulator [Nocardia albiluteola]MBU3061050.1 MarR family transcriptional regulator [Nocardia albiluteola]